MIPWWLVALLVAESRPKVSADQNLQRKIDVVSARITKRYAEQNARALTYLERLRYEESGHIPADILKARLEILEDWKLLQSLMAEQYRRAGGEQRLERR